MQQGISSCAQTCVIYRYCATRLLTVIAPLHSARARARPVIMTHPTSPVCKTTQLFTHKKSSLFGVLTDVFVAFFDNLKTYYVHYRCLFQRVDRLDQIKDWRSSVNKIKGLFCKSSLEEDPQPWPQGNFLPTVPLTNKRVDLLKIPTKQSSITSKQKAFSKKSS